MSLIFKKVDMSVAIMRNRNRFAATSGLCACSLHDSNRARYSMLKLKYQDLTRRRTSTVRTVKRLTTITSSSRSQWIYRLYKIYDTQTWRDVTTGFSICLIPQSPPRMICAGQLVSTEILIAGTARVLLSTHQVVHNTTLHPPYQP